MMYENWLNKLGKIKMNFYPIAYKKAYPKRIKALIVKDLSTKLREVNKR